MALNQYLQMEKDNYPLSVYHRFLASPSTKLLENKLISFPPMFLQEILKPIYGVEQKNTTGLFISS